jgi:hypothetical protein
VVKRLLIVALLGACVLDPVNDERSADLGDETPGIPQGPLHRAGQPCLACHDEMLAAGTVYAIHGESAPLRGVTVTLTDVSGATKAVTTNEVGNFFVEKNQWNATFPLHATVTYGSTSTTMSSIIGRDGSCATCHLDPLSRISAGPVYVAPTAALLSDGGAP